MRMKFFSGVLVLTAALLLLALGKTNARTSPVERLKGTCIWQQVGYPTTSGNQQNIGPATILASVHFDGDGAMVLNYDVNINGQYSSTDAVPGSYSVDSTGHGSFSFKSPASGIFLTYDFRISRMGHTLYTILQSYAGYPLTPRVTSGTCSFQEEDREER